MITHKAIKIVFEHNLTGYDRYAGWDYCYSNGEKITISICPSALAYIDGQHNKFEFVYDRDGKLLGTQEEFTLNTNFVTDHWFFIYEDTNLDIKKLYYHKDGRIKFIKSFDGFDNANEVNRKDLMNADELKVEWYDEKGKKYASIFYPDGTSDKTKKSRPPSMRQIRKRRKEIEKKGMFL